MRWTRVSDKVCPPADRASGCAGRLLPGRGTEQLIELLPHDAVALARRRLQAGTVEHGYPAVRVLDRAYPLQDTGCDRDAGPAGAQHERQELVRHWELVLLGPVVLHQEPAGE